MTTIVRCFNGEVEHADCCEVAENNPEDGLIPDIRDVDCGEWLQGFLGDYLRYSGGHKVKITIKIDIL